MKKQKTSKEKKVDELKKFKKLNVGLVGQLVEVNTKLAKADSDKRHTSKKAEELEKQLVSVKEELKNARQHLADIQKAIETAAAMRYPDAAITYSPEIYKSDLTVPRNSDDSEDVRLLRYLYGLSKRPTESNLHRMY